MTAILVGTCGYGYTQWVGPVYPEGTKPAQFLSSYAALFPTVELNQPFYRMPTAAQFQKNLEQAGPSLVFAVKVNMALTHRMDFSSWEAHAEDFKSAIEPLREAKRLAAVLFQFPPQFQNEEARRRYLFALLDAFVDIPVALEFRNAGWYNNAMVEICRQRRIAFVSTDLPELPGLPPLMDVVTAPFAYFRFHGRNGAGWAGRDETSRYDYVYSAIELESLAARVKGIAQRTERIFVYFNNTGMIQNARTFIDILTRIGLLP
jgi:uncharacterized protein YecE (DUF72 family)